MTQFNRNFWRSVWSDGINLPGCLQLKNKNSPSTIKNHLLFDVQTAYRGTRDRETETDRQKDRQTDSARVYERTQKDKPHLIATVAQSAGAVECTDCFSAVG